MVAGEEVAGGKRCTQADRNQVGPNRTLEGWVVGVRRWVDRML